MPQLDFSIFPSQLFWLCICFFTMLFIMSKLIIPRIAEMIELRREKIEGNLEKAAEIKAEAEKSLEKYRKALQDATNDANQSLLKTQQELQAMIERKQDDLSAKLSAQIAEGEKKILNSKNKALQQVNDISAEIAVEIMKKLDLKDIKIQDFEKTLKTSLKD